MLILAKQRRHVVGKQVGLSRDVLTVSRERVRRALECYEKPLVSFSGGKDSTVVLNLVVEEAKALGRLPVDVFFADEEIVAPETIEYVRRVAQLPSIRLFWSCIPLRHRNACSKTEPWWYTWHPDQRETWVREMPPEAQTALAHPDVPWTTITKAMGQLRDIERSATPEVQPQLDAIAEYLEKLAEPSR